MDPNANAETMYRDKGCCKMGAFPPIRGEQGVNKKEHHHHVMAFCPFSVCVCDSGAWITLGACVSHEKCLVCFNFLGSQGGKACVWRVAASRWKPLRFNCCRSTEEGIDRAMKGHHRPSVRDQSKVCVTFAGLG